MRLTTEIMQSTQVTILDVMVALLPGVAARLALLRKIPEILVGVAVAVALLPHRHGGRHHARPRLT